MENMLLKKGKSKTLIVVGLFLMFLVSVVYGGKIIGNVTFNADTQRTDDEYMRYLDLIDKIDEINQTTYDINIRIISMNGSTIFEMKQEIEAIQLDLDNMNSSYFHNWDEYFANWNLYFPYWNIPIR